MSEILYSQTVAAQMLGISRGTLVKRIRKGEIREYQKKPSKITHSEIERLGGVVPPVLSEGQASGNDDELFSTDISKAGEEHVRLPGSPPMGSRIRMEMTPWLRAPLNCFSDATPERIILMSSAPVGKTLSALCMTMWSVCEQLGNLLFCQHTEAAAKDFAQLRMNPILNECAPVSALMPTWGKGGRSMRGHTRNESKILFGTGSWLQCKPANMSSMRGHSARYSIADEAAEYTAGALANAIARISLFPNKKIVVTSTPLCEGEGETGNEFTALYKAGT